MVPGFKPAVTEIAQYNTRDLSPDFQVSDRSPREIATVAEIFSRPRAFFQVKRASTSFQAPLGNPDRGVAWPLVRVRPFPTLSLGKGDVSLGGVLKRHLACAPKGRRTPLPLRALLVCSRPLPPIIPGGDRVIRGEGVPPTYLPPQGLRLARPRPCPTAPHWPGGAPGGTFGLAPPGPLYGIPFRAAPGLGPLEGPNEPLPSRRTKRSPSLRGPDYSGVPCASSSSQGGTAPRARVRGSSPLFADLVPRPRVVLIGVPLGPVSRGPMASADAAHGTAAMAVDCRGGALGDVLGEEEEIKGTLTSLPSASWPTPAVVDDSFRSPGTSGGPW